MIISKFTSKVLVMYAEVGAISVLALAIMATVYFNPWSLLGWGALLLFCISEVVRDQTQFPEGAHDDTK